jgi:hypothetical protein
MISPEVLDELRALRLDGVAFGAVVRRASGPEPLVRAALLHMLWSHAIDADLSDVLSDKTVLVSRAAA